jgi:putative NIF3 family GTP cyclohydrolase 1 type 2
MHLAKLLGLNNKEFLVSEPEFQDNRPEALSKNRGMGCIGHFDGDFKGLISKVAEVCQIFPRFTDYSFERKVRKVAIICGSGLSFAEAAQKAGAEVLITSDMSYHMFRAYGDMLIIDPGHWEMEQWSGEIMSEMLSVFFSNSDLVIFDCGVRTNFAKQYSITPTHS